MRWKLCFVVVVWVVFVKSTPTQTNSTCSPLPTPDLLADPALVGLEAGYVPYAHVPVDIPHFCAKFEIIVARGILESGDNAGERVGQPLVNKVFELTRGTSIGNDVLNPEENKTISYPVQYPAALGNPKFGKSSVETGIDDVVLRLEKENKRCPEKKFALVGSTMGAEVIRGSIRWIEESIKSKILAIVLFSDPALRLCSPPLPPPLQGRLFENCIIGDSFCDREAALLGSIADANLPSDFAPWLVYGDGSPSQRESAEFIVAAFLGKPLPARVAGTQSPPGGALPTVGSAS